MKVENKNDIILPSIIITLGLVISSFLLSRGIFYLKDFHKEIASKGHSERIVKSDLVIWKMGISFSGNDLLKIHKDVNTQKQLLLSFLKEKGFEDTSLEFLPLSLNDANSNQYSTNQPIMRFTATLNAQLISPKVDLVKSVSQDVQSLLAKGIIIQKNEVSFFYKGLNNIKNEMLKEASENCKDSAKTFALDTGVKLGALKSAHQGLFTISDSLESNDYSYRNQSISKIVRVVVQNEYFIE